MEILAHDFPMSGHARNWRGPALSPLALLRTVMLLSESSFFRFTLLHRIVDFMIGTVASRS